MNGSDMLCALCAAAMTTFAAVRVVAVAPNGEPDNLTMRYRVGPELVQAARGAIADGKMIDIDNMRAAGIYAETLYRGSAVCLSHVAHLRDETRTGHKADWW